MDTAERWLWLDGSTIRGNCSRNNRNRDLPISRTRLIRLEDLYERAEERSQQLQQTYELHDEWKKRGDKLLYSMIPQSVADKLRSGTDPVETCQVKFIFIRIFAILTNL